MVATLYQELLYRPLLNGLIALYEFLPGRDLGVAIIALTVLVRILLIPLVVRQYRSQRALQALQPKISELRSRVKQPQEQSRQLMALYKDQGVHPASGCLPVLLQLPILIAMYRVLINGLHPDALAGLYAWVPHPGTVEAVAFGFLNLASPNPVLAVLAGASQYVQSRLLLPPPRAPQGKAPERDISSMMSTQALYVMPVITVVFALGFPAGLSLYWVTTTVLGILQQILLSRRYGSLHPTPSAAKG